MPRIVAMGGGVVGLSMAMLLAKQGHEVTVLEQIDASIEGRPAPEPPGPMAQFQQAFGVAMLYDPDVYRGTMEFISMMALPEQVFTRDGFGARVAAAAEGREAFSAPGPSRSDLLKALA